MRRTGRKIADQWLRGILGTLYQRSTVTRAEIIEATGLNVASVSHGIKQLLRSGTIFRIGELESNGGRKREVLRLNGDAAYLIAVDLEGTRIRFAVTNLLGDIRYRFEEDIEFGVRLEMRRVVNGIRMALRNLSVPQRSRILAMGMSHPGVTGRDGRITAVNVGWRGVPLREELQGFFEFPIFSEDAHQTCVLAEHWFGRAQNCNNFVYVGVGNGIGAGIFVDGKPLTGRNQMNGELGHVTVDRNAPDRCNCGKTGCLEAIGSTPNIVRQYLALKKRTEEHMAGALIREVFEMGRKRDKDAVAVLDRAARALGFGLACLANLLNPEMIILGGDIVSGEDVFLPTVREELLAQTLPEFRQGLTLSVSSLGPDIGLKGAASLAFRNSLLDPVLLARMCSPVLRAMG